MKPVHARIRYPLLSAILGALVLLAACAPQTATVANTTLPHIFSVRTDGDRISIQGRYLGDGAGGIDAGNYVLLATNANAEGGLIYPTTSWSSNRIELVVPASVNARHIFVVVDGTRSNGLIVNR